MAHLTISQKSFLDSQKISTSVVFDATGMKKVEYQRQMKLLGKEVAIGVTPCREEGHTLRTRSGHCFQCNPASIAFQKRHSAKGYVYIAGSRKLKLIKVGFSKDVKERRKSLNSLGYAGGDDWVILYWVTCDNAGKVEFDIHRELSRYSHASSYQREGKTVNCLETFSCGAETAISVLGQIAVEKAGEWRNSKEIHLYDFSCVKGREVSNNDGRGRSSSLNKKEIVPEATKKRTKLSVSKESISKPYGIGSIPKARNRILDERKAKTAKRKSKDSYDKNIFDERELAAARSKQLKQRLEKYKEARAQMATVRPKPQQSLEGEREGSTDVDFSLYILAYVVLAIFGSALFTYLVGLVLIST